MTAPVVTEVAEAPEGGPPSTPRSVSWGLRTLRRPAMIVAILVVSLAVATGCRLRPDPVPTPGYKQIAFYGDSLLSSSLPRWRYLTVVGLERWSVVERADWGSAVCDHRDQMAADANPRWNIRVVVLSFYGNQKTRCSTGPDAEALYRSDLEWAVRFWQERDVRVVLVATPGRVGDEPYPPGARAARTVARELDVELVDLTSAFIDPDTGRYAEEIDGLAVRSPDGLHLCDHETVGELVCPVDAPGVVRYADPIAAAAIAQAKLVK